MPIHTLKVIHYLYASRSIFVPGANSLLYCLQIMDKLIGGVIYPYPVYFANITGVDLANFERTEVRIVGSLIQCDCSGYCRALLATTPSILIVLRCVRPYMLVVLLMKMDQEMWAKH